MNSNTRANANIIKAALKYRKGGLSVLPADNKSKRPLIKWGRLKNELPPIKEVEMWFSKADQPGLSVAIVCGKISGNLEIIDFDFKGMMFDSWKKIVKRRRPSLFRRLVIEETQNKGFHVVYRCSKKVGPSDHLAFPKKKSGKRRKAAIETKAQGGYFLCAPSPGYRVIQGDFQNIPIISPRDRKFIIKTAQSLNEWIHPNKVERGYKKKAKHGLLPGKDFDKRGDISPILEKHGWKAVGKNNGKFQHYRRPGKKEGSSASLIDGKIFNCFTTNGPPFEANTAYGPFAVYALLEHNGDFKAAAKRLRKQGYGKKGEVEVKTNQRALDKKLKKILDTKRPTKRFETSALPSLLADYIDELCQTTSADPIIITQSVLCTISAIVGKRCFIPETTYFDTLYGNLWTLTIGLSGTFKTTALNRGSEIAMQMRQEILERYDILNTRLGLAKEKDAEKIRKKILKLDKRNPVLPEESSIEGLLEVLGQRDGGMIICSEFGDWYEGISRSYKLGFKKLLTNLYDVPMHRQVKTKTSGTITVYRPYITINAASTLTWLEDSINKRDIASGFLARFLIFYPPDNKRTPPPRPIRIERDHTLVDQIQERLKSVGSKEPRAFSLGKKGGRLYDKICQSIYQEFKRHTEKTREQLDPFIKRWCPSILKIAMLLQVIEDPKTDIISEKAIRGAHSIVDYAIQSTLFLLRNELGESEQQKKKAKVLKYIAKRKGRVTKGKLIRSKILDGGVKEYGNVMETLMAEGSVQLIEKGKKKEYDWEYAIIA